MIKGQDNVLIVCVDKDNKKTKLCKDRGWEKGLQMKGHEEMSSF